MKKEFLTGLTAMVLAIGLALAGCESPTNGSNGGQGGPGTPGAIVGAAGTLDGLKAFLAENASGTFYYVGNEALNAGDTLSIGDGQVVVVIPFNELNGRAAAPANPAVAGITLNGGTLTVGGGASGRLKIDSGAHLTVTSGVFNAAAASFVAIADGAGLSIADSGVTGTIAGTAVFAIEDVASITQDILDGIGTGKVLAGSIDPAKALTDAVLAATVVFIPEELPVNFEIASGKTLVLSAAQEFGSGALTLKPGVYTFATASSIVTATGVFTIGGALTGSPDIAATAAALPKASLQYVGAGKVTYTTDAGTPLSGAALTGAEVHLAGDTVLTGNLTLKNANNNAVQLVIDTNGTLNTGAQTIGNTGTFTFGTNVLSAGITFSTNTGTVKLNIPVSLTTGLALGTTTTANKLFPGAYETGAAVAFANNGEATIAGNLTLTDGAKIEAAGLGSFAANTSVQYLKTADLSIGAVGTAVTLTGAYDITNFTGTVRFPGGFTTTTNAFTWVANGSITGGAALTLPEGTVVTTADATITLGGAFVTPANAVKLGTATKLKSTTGTITVTSGGSLGVTTTPMITATAANLVLPAGTSFAATSGSAATLTQGNADVVVATGGTLTVATGVTWIVPTSYKIANKAASPETVIKAGTYITSGASSLVADSGVLDITIANAGSTPDIETATLTTLTPANLVKIVDVDAKVKYTGALALGGVAITNFAGKVTLGGGATIASGGAFTIAGDTTIATTNQPFAIPAGSVIDGTALALYLNGNATVAGGNGTVVLTSTSIVTGVPAAAGGYVEGSVGTLTIGAGDNLITLTGGTVSGGATSNTATLDAAAAGSTIALISNGGTPAVILDNGGVLDIKGAGAVTLTAGIKLLGGSFTATAADTITLGVTAGALANILGTNAADTLTLGSGAAIQVLSAADTAGLTLTKVVVDISANGTVHLSAGEKLTLNNADTGLGKLLLAAGVGNAEKSVYGPAGSTTAAAIAGVSNAVGTIGEGLRYHNGSGAEVTEAGGNDTIGAAQAGTPVAGTDITKASTITTNG
jgi:hypothetical protein